MVDMNISTFTTEQVMQNPLGLDQYTTIQACKEYVAHTTTMNYVWMAVALFAIIGMFLILKKRGLVKPPKIFDDENEDD